MQALNITVAVFLVCAFQKVKGKSTYERCTVYDQGDEIPPVGDGKGRHCKNSTGPLTMRKEGEPEPPKVQKTYCLDYQCPALDCDAADIVKEDGKCNKCKGDCEWLGKIVRNGTVGGCEDGCNRCGCLNGAVSMSTLMYCPTWFCFPQRLLSSFIKS